MTSINIDILVCIDTLKIKKDFPGGISKDPNNPTGLNHIYQYMIASNSRDAGMKNKQRNMIKEKNTYCFILPIKEFLLAREQLICSLLLMFVIL